jgi:pimeloyl-[acyl-carrier protein] methyl ester esterase
MPPPEPPLQVIAMHGWAGDAAGWIGWPEAFGAEGWRWRSGERGYGGAPPHLPQWEPRGGRRVLIAHSLGPHLLPPDLLARAEAVVLLASFARFVPEGPAGRRLRTALAGMAAVLGDATADPRPMLRSFLAEAAAPQPVEDMPPGPADRPAGAIDRELLSRDLELLRQTASLPPGFPAEAPVLLVEAAEDRIVVPEAQQLLRRALPQADLVRLEGTGHALLGTAVIRLSRDWLKGRARP